MLCRLCLADKPLRNSHIIPEFIYKHGQMYGEHHRFVALSTNPMEREQLYQKGLYEKLLCQDCESLFDRQYERYGKKVLFDDRDIHIFDEPGKDFCDIRNIDYARFKLFLVSILWRAGVSDLPDFANISLGTHTERLRKMLLNQDPGEPYEYGSLIISPRSEFGLEKHGMMSPRKIKCAGYNGAIFLFGGYLWWYIVSSHAHKFPFKDKFLLKSGSGSIVNNTVSGQVLDVITRKMFAARKSRNS